MEKSDIKKYVEEKYKNESTNTLYFTLVMSYIYKSNQVRCVVPM